VSPDGSEPSTTTPSLRLLVALSAVAVVLASIHLALPLASVPRLAPLNYNEGWNGYHAEAVFSERPLYPPAGDLFPDNYPPLSFAVIALLARVVGDPILSGRLLSLLSLLAIVVELALLGRRTGGSLGHGLFASALFVALLGAAFGDYVGIDDPQLFAHALVLGGLVLVAGGRTTRRLGGAAVLMVLGGLVKHNLIAVPLAVTWWLWTLDRRAFRLWLMISAGVGGTALLGLWLLYGPDVFAAILARRDVSLLVAARMSAEWLPSLAAPLAVGLLALREAWRDDDARLLALYAGFSLVLGLVFLAGEGVGYNVLFDLTMALSLLGVFLLARAGRTIPAAAIGLALLVGPLVRAPAAFLALPSGLADLRKLDAATWQDVAYLTPFEGPALCETLALCFWAGKPPTVDLFNSQQAFRAGRADERALADQLSHGAFAIVQLTSIYKGRDDDRLSALLTDALQHNYVVDRTSANGVFLRPRGGPPR
jgi:hypothetical protein